MARAAINDPSLKVSTVLAGHKPAHRRARRFGAGAAAIVLSALVAPLHAQDVPETTNTNEDPSSPDDESPERRPQTRALFENPDLSQLTFDQNRADRLGRFPDRDRLRERRQPGGDMAVDRVAIRLGTRRIYLATLQPERLAADAVPPAQEASHADRRANGAPGVQLAAAGSAPSDRVQSARAPDYGELAALLGDDPQAAIAKLDKLTEANPNDGRLWQLLGAARLRVEDYGQAVGALRLAIEHGRDKPLVRQALGDALLGADEPSAALEQLRQGPDSGRNRLGRATALIRLDQPEAALPLLDEALRLAPDLEARVRAVRAGALKLLDRREEAAREIARGRAQTRDRELLDSYDRIGRPDRARGTGRWGIRAALEAGYNDNVALRSDSAPATGADESDYVAAPSLSGWVIAFDSPTTEVVVDANVDGRLHADRDEFDEVFADGGVQVNHELADAWEVSAGVGADYGNIDGDSYLVSTGANVALYWQQTDWSETSVSYTASYRDFLFQTVASEDRDGVLHRGVLAQTLRFDDIAAGAELSPYASLSREQTEGASAENYGWGVGLDAQVRPVDDLTLFAGGGYRAYDYDNPSVRTNFTDAREDQTWHARAGVRYRARDWAEIGVRYDFTDKDSNIPASFSYEQNSVMLTLTLWQP